MRDDSTRVTFVCRRCEEPFSLSLAEARKRSGTYCSMACRRPPQIIQLHPTEPGVSIIVLANNDTPALISTCDAERVATRYWRASYENKHWYVISSASSSGPRVSLHRFIMDAGPRQMVDHRFGDGFDNRREMLRFCNNSQNGANTPNRKRPTSGYYGVSVANGGLMWYRNPWQVIMRVHGKVTYLGRYATAEEAARVYDAKAREVYGEFATLNFPDEVEHEDAA